MNNYKHEMDKLKLSEQGKRRVLALYSREASKKEERNMIKLVKPLAAVAACATLLLGSVISGNLAVKGGNKTPSGHDFMITAYAEELDETNPVIVYNGRELCNSMALCGMEGDQGVSYSLQTDFACEGEGIASVTYKINQGAFHILKPKSTKLDISMKEVPGMSVPISGYPHVAAVDESLCEAEREDSEKVVEYYASEYTLDYANQTPENVVFNICGNRQMDPDKMFGNQTPEEEKAGMDELVGDIVITCTVTFTDGTSVSKEIVTENKIMTPKEAEPEAVAHDAKLSDNEDFANKRTNYLFFRMK